jgi:hypothetical protein
VPSVYLRLPAVEAFRRGRFGARPMRVAARLVLIFLRQERPASEPGMPARGLFSSAFMRGGRIEPGVRCRVSRALLGSAFVSRNAQEAAARAAFFVIAAWLVSACGHGGGGTVASGGVVWDRLTPPEVIEADRPDWRADSIAFQVTVLGSDRVAVAREDGSSIAIQPETGSFGARAPRWVRAGLFVESSDRGGSEDIWFREIMTGVTRRLTAFPGMEWTPVPRPGDAGIVYVEGTDPDSGRLVLIPDTSATPLGRIYLTPAALGAGEPSFSPAGDQICFSAAGPSGSRQIWRLSFSDTLAIQLTVAPSTNPPSGPTVDRSPRWSPDGTRILMASNRGGRWGVWTLSPMGEALGLDVIAQDLKGAVIRHPAWSPDGSKIVVSSDRSGGRALWRLSNLGP